MTLNHPDTAFAALAAERRLAAARADRLAPLAAATSTARRCPVPVRGVLDWLLAAVVAGRGQGPVPYPAGR